MGILAVFLVPVAAFLVLPAVYGVVGVVGLLRRDGR